MKISHGASCSFCSKIDDAIHVICEGRCLICSNCQRSLKIKLLLIRCLDQATLHSTDVLCPICTKIMAPNMITSIKRTRKESTQNESLNSRDALLQQPNSYVVQAIALLQKKPPRSRRTIVDGNRKSPSPTHDLHLLNEEETIEGSSLSGDASTILSRPSIIKSPIRKKSELKSVMKPSKSIPKTKSKKEKRDVSPSTPGVQNQIQIPIQPISTIGYTTLGMLDLMAEVYTKVWELYLKDIFHPLVDIIKDIFAHNRLSRNLVDPKMRSVLDYFSNLVPAITYSVRKYQPLMAQSSDMSGTDSRSQSRSSTPRRDTATGTAIPTISTTTNNNNNNNNNRPSTTGGIPQLTNFSPKRLLLHLPPPPLADYPTANSHFYLFGRVLGILPTLQTQIRPSLIYIVTMVFVMAVCEKCLKYNQLIYDEEGIGVMKPSPAEFNLRLTLTASSARQSLIAPKIATIPLRKAILILKCLISTIQENHFTLRSLQPACIEYDSDLPWNESSITALISMLLTPTYTQSSTSTSSPTPTPSSFGPSILIRLYTTMRAEAQLRAEEASRLVATPDPSSSPSPHGSRPTTAKVYSSSNNGNNNNNNSYNNNNNNSSKVMNKNVPLIIKPTINGIPVPDSKDVNLGTTDIYPPVHLLASVVTRLWKEKDSLKPISFDTALKILSAKHSTTSISLPYFLLMVCEAWTMECETVLHKIKIKKYSNSRRHGLKPQSTPFTKSSSTLAIAEKKTLHFIYNKYADKTISSFENLNKLPEVSETNTVNTNEVSLNGSDGGNRHKTMSSTGVDWDLVRAECNDNSSLVPYWHTRPEFLTEKSNAELEHLTKIVMLAIRKREEWERLVNESGWHDEWMWGGIEIRPGYVTTKEQRHSFSDGMSVETLKEFYKDKKIPTSQVCSPPALKDYQQRLMNRINTTTSSDIYDLDMKDLAKKMGKMSSVWEVSQATSRTISDTDWNPDSENSMTIQTNQDDDLFDKDDTVTLALTEKSKSVRTTSAKSYRRPSSFGDLLTNGKYFQQLSLPTTPSMSILPSPLMSPTSNMEDFPPISGRHNPNSSPGKIKLQLSETIYTVAPSPTTLALVMKKDERPTLTTVQSLLPLQPSNSQKIVLNTSYSSPALPITTTSLLSNHRKPVKSERLQRHEIYMTDILNPKIGSEILTKAGFLEPPPKAKVIEVNNPISSSGSFSSVDPKVEENIIDSSPDYSPVFHINPQELKRRLLSPPIGHNRSNPKTKFQDETEEECLIFRTMAPSGVQNRKTVDLGHYGNIRESEIPSSSPYEDIQSLILTDVGLSPEGLADVLEKFTPSGSTLETLRKLDLSGNRVGEKGIILLADTLADNCASIADICIKSTEATDRSIHELLGGICDGGGQESLLRLDLSSNNLPFTQDLSRRFINFENLKLLDLSWNTITLKLPSQKKNIKEILTLPQLEAFSLSYNRIGDAGLIFCLESIPQKSRLKVLDLAHIFATENSCDAIISFLKRSKSIVELLMLQGIVLSEKAINNIHNTSINSLHSDGSHTHVFLDGHHTGITIPLKYTDAVIL